MEQLCLAHGPGCNSCDSKREFVYVMGKTWQTAKNCMGGCGEVEETEGCRSCGRRYCSECMGGKRMFFEKCEADALRVCNSCIQSRMSENKDMKFVVVFSKTDFPHFNECVDLTVSILSLNPGVSLISQDKLYSCDHTRLSPTKCSEPNCKPEITDCLQHKIELYNIVTGVRVWTFDPSGDTENVALKFLNYLLNSPFEYPEKQGTKEKLEGVYTKTTQLVIGDNSNNELVTKKCRYCLQLKPMSPSSGTCSSCLQVGCGPSLFVISRSKHSELTLINALCLEIKTRIYLKDYGVQSLFTHESTGYYCCSNCHTMFISGTTSCPQCQAMLFTKNFSENVGKAKKSLSTLQPIVEKVAPVVAWGAEKGVQVGAAVGNFNKLTNSVPVYNNAPTSAIKERCSGITQISLNCRFSKSNMPLHDFRPIDEESLNQITTQLSTITAKHEKGVFIVKNGHATFCNGTCKGRCGGGHVVSKIVSDWKKIPSSPQKAPSKKLTDFCKVIVEAKATVSRENKIIFIHHHDGTKKFEIKPTKFIIHSDGLISLEYNRLHPAEDSPDVENPKMKITTEQIPISSEKDFLQQELGIVDVAE